MRSPLVVLVDDNPGGRALALRALRKECADLRVLEIVDEPAFARLLEGPSPDLVLSDDQVGWTSGLEVLRAVKHRWPLCPVILFTDAGSEDVAVEAMKAGLSDYVIKTPAHFRRFPAAVRSALALAEERRSARAEAERWQLLLESVPECVKTLDAECRVLHMNSAGLRMIDAEIQDVLGKSVLERILPGHHRAFRALVERVFLGELGSLEFEMVGLKGRRRWVLSRLAPVRDPAGRVSEALIVTFDLTEQRAADAARREQAILLERVLATLPVGVWIVDHTGNIIHSNPAGQSIWAGVRLGGIECYGEYKGWWPDTGRLIGGEEWAASRALMRGETSLGEQIDIEAFDGTRKRILNSAVPLRDENGAITGAIVVNQDITDQHLAQQTLRRREQELHQAQKLEALGRLAGGVAHDFNNLLTGILGLGELVLITLGEGDTRREQVLGIQRAARRAASLTRQLLAFSHRQELEPVVLDLNALIQDMRPMLGRLIAGQCELTYELQPDLWRTRADPGQLELVVLNLALNARDALQTGGKVEIRTLNLELGVDQAREGGIQPGRFVCLEVRDDGSGMTPEVKQRLFEPFFTTKALGAGTGLGLSTVYGIVEQSGGHVLVVSDPGKGSTFSVLLPQVEGEAQARPVPLPVAESPLRKTVLVVEDEGVVLELISTVLGSAGFNVLPASTPAEALRLCRAHEGAIDLGLIDVVMPGASGPEVLREAKILRPELRGLFMSGHPGPMITADELAETGTELIRKPFTSSELTARIRQALER